MERQYREREAKARRRELRKDNYDIKVLLLGESSEDDNELQESGKLNTLEMAAIREQ